MKAILRAMQIGKAAKSTEFPRYFERCRLTGGCYCSGLEADPLFSMKRQDWGEGGGGKNSRPHQSKEQCMDPISSIERTGTVAGIDATAALSSGHRTGGVSFGKALEDALANVSQLQNQSQTMARDFQAESPNVTLEETMIAMQQSSLSFQAVVQVRNKLVSAYSEMMNMQV
jgi:flagellar hook-basal body complex protein FliE